MYPSKKNRLGRVLTMYGMVHPSLSHDIGHRHLFFKEDAAQQGLQRDCFFLSGPGAGLQFTRSGTRSAVQRGRSQNGRLVSSMIWTSFRPMSRRICALSACSCRRWRQTARAVPVRAIRVRMDGAARSSATPRKTRNSAMAFTFCFVMLAFIDISMVDICGDIMHFESECI